MKYDFLVDLHRGRAAVVENMTLEQRAALKIDTPLTAFIERAAREGDPKHVVITGNAGDGKTFAAVQSVLPGMTTIVDASARLQTDPVGLDPIEALADRIANVLSVGRLLLAINRGQLERLARFCRTKPHHSAAAFALAASERAETRPIWKPETSRDVAVIDLGLFDTTSGLIVDAMLEKVVNVDVSDLSEETRQIVVAATEALKSAHVRAWVKRVVLEVAARGGHLTLRQLWSFVAFLVVGGRPADSQSPPSLRDSVGARLFRYEDASMFEEAILAIDPAYHLPRPDLARMLLSDDMADTVVAAVGLPLTSADGGADVIRALTIHDPARNPPEGVDNYQRFSTLLRAEPPGWHSHSTIATKLLVGIYRTLGLWQAAGAFPAWQALCYDSSRLRYEGTLSAAVAANASVDPGSLRFALPRAHPAAEDALAGAWRPPCVLLAFEHAAGSRTGDALRLTPRLFRALYSPETQLLDPLTGSEMMSLERWLARAPRAGAGDVIRVSGATPTPLRVEVDPLSRKTLIAWEGSGDN